MYNFISDIDECELNYINRCGRKAEVLCINTIGSYTCDCIEGYILQDNITCIGKKNISPQLLLSQNNP